MTVNRLAPLVFVVDDDVTTNRMIQAILSRAGFRTTGAFTATGALAGFREHRPDLVLLDVNLPDGSGFEVCRRMQTVQGAVQTPVLFISANEDVPSKLQGFEAGGVDYIPKPVSGEEMLARVSTHLRLRQASETLARLQAERIQRLASAQETLMPTPADLPEAKFEIALQQVLQAGGDFYDVIPIGSRVTDYIVADTSGHDLAASFWTAALKTLISEYATPAQSPRDVLRSINNSLCRILPQGIYFTVIYGRLNRQSSKLLLVSAAHPPALLVRRGGACGELLRQASDVVGSFPDATFDSIEVTVRPGDRFFLFTDGLIELHGAREAGLSCLRETACAFPDLSLRDHVREIHHKLVDGLELRDDIVLMGVEV
jgi:sigma-B regulation protein RsbU (phosphoserine phosphatase)